MTDGDFLLQVPASNAASADLLNLGSPTQTTAPPLPGGGESLLVDMFDTLTTNATTTHTSNGIGSDLALGAEEAFKK